MYPIVRRVSSVSSSGLTVDAAFNASAVSGALSGLGACRSESWLWTSAPGIPVLFDAVPGQLESQVIAKLKQGLSVSLRGVPLVKHGSLFVNPDQIES
jgi:hypothetical protein